MKRILALTLVAAAAAFFVPVAGAQTVTLTTPFTCTSTQNLDLLKVTSSSSSNAFNLDPGCTGTIDRIEIDSTIGGDGLKCRTPPGAINLTISGGWVKVHGQTPTGNHTDGFQAGTCRDVNISNVAFMTGAPIPDGGRPAGNAAWFMSGFNGGTPTRISCDHCAIGPWSASEMLPESYEFSAPQAENRLTNSRICEQFDQSGAHAGTGTPAVYEGNEFVDRSDPTYWDKCSQAGLLAYVNVTAAPACSDGADNDSDLLVDFPADPGCLSATDDDEFNDPAPPAPYHPACEPTCDAQIAALQAQVADLEAQRATCLNDLAAANAEVGRRGDIIDRAAAVLAEK